MTADELVFFVNGKKVRRSWSDFSAPPGRVSVLWKRLVLFFLFRLLSHSFPLSSSLSLQSVAAWVTLGKENLLRAGTEARCPRGRGVQGRQMRRETWVPTQSAAAETVAQS